MFQKGNKFGKGRPKGSGNKISEALKEKFISAPEKLFQDIESLADPEARIRWRIEVLKLITPKPVEVSEDSGEQIFTLRYKLDEEKEG